MKNKPQTVEDIVREGYEDTMGEYELALILTNDRLAHKTALLEAIGNYDTKEHICGFNDGDCDCECFLAGRDTMTDIINKIYTS